MKVIVTPRGDVARTIWEPGDIVTNVGTATYYPPYYGSHTPVVCTPAYSPPPSYSDNYNQADPPELVAKPKRPWWMFTFPNPFFKGAF